MSPVIPSSPGEVTSSWLAEVLDTDVLDVSVTPVGTGQTGATYRVTPTYSADRCGLPDTFIVKLPSQDEAVRQRVAGGYRCEFAFYTEVADTVAVPLPHCFHCEIDRDGADFVLLLSDLAPAVQGDQIAGCNAVEARLAVEALAGLHGPRWCDPRWLAFTGAMMPKLDADAAKGIGELAIMATDTTIGMLDERITAADRGTLCEAAALVSAWILLEPQRFSILHGDYRIDNLLFDPERSQGHRRRLADHVHRPACARPRVLRGDQFASRTAGADRARAGGRVSRGIAVARRNGLRHRLMLA